MKRGAAHPPAPEDVPARDKEEVRPCGVEHVSMFLRPLGADALANFRIKKSRSQSSQPNTHGEEDSTPESP